MKMNHHAREINTWTRADDKSRLRQRKTSSTDSICALIQKDQTFELKRYHNWVAFVHYFFEKYVRLISSP